MAETYRDRMYGAYVRSLRGAEEVDKAPSMESQRPALERVIQRHFPQDRSAAIVDLGCGSGQLLHFAARAGYTNLAGLDVSPEQVRRAHALGLTGVKQGDLTPWLNGTPDASYDVVISYDVLEHFTKDEVIPFVDSVRRILKPGGRWLIHVPNAQSPFGMSVRYGDFTHELAFTPKSLTQLLTASGFSSVTCYEEEPIPHGAKSAARWVVWKGVKAALRVWNAAETGEYKPMVLSRNVLAVAMK